MAVIRKVSVRQYRNIDGKWQFCAVPKDAKGKPKPNLVIVKGETISSSSPGGGHFYLDYADENGKRIRKSCGVSPREALDAWTTQVGIHAGKIDLADVASSEEDDNQRTVASAIKQFLLEVKATKSAETHRAYTNDSEWFMEKMNHKFANRVTRTDILAVFGAGRTEKLAQRTINRRVLVGLMALRNAGATVELKKGDWPKVPETEIEIYSNDEIKKFFDACTDDEALLFKVYLCTGFRNREVSTLDKLSVKAQDNKLGVKARPEYEFKPKNYECREVRIPASLMEELVAHMKKGKGCSLVFPSKPHPKRPNYGGDKPDAHHLELCKEIAHRAGLNCGLCVTPKSENCADSPVCENWYLHKWRHTFATNSLRDGIDIKTLQKLLGHKNMSTTEKYLKALHVDDLADKVEASTIAGLVA